MKENVTPTAGASAQPIVVPHNDNPWVVGAIIVVLMVLLFMVAIRRQD